MKFQLYPQIGLVIVFFLLLLKPGVGQDKIYTSQRTTHPPKIDGVLDDKAWDKVAWGNNFVQRYPQSEVPPSFQTMFKILYDDNNLYVAIKMLDDEPDKIVRRLSRRDGNEGDWVTIGFDSYNDNLTAYNFGVNAVGVKRDLITTNDASDDTSWDAVYYVKVSIDDEGWNAEFRIPLSQLRFAKLENYEWGLQIQRNIFRFDERSTWQSVARDVKGWVSKWGTLCGIKGIKPKLDIEIMPYTVLKSENYLPEDGNPYEDGTDNSISAGVDGKVSLSNDFTINFTINPDFGQVEADPSEVNLSAFETFFQEKRPFFIEGKNIFSFPITAGGGFGNENLFYSRRIGRRPHLGSSDLGLDDYYSDMPDNANILAAFKLSGKTKNGLSVGILESITPKTNADFSDGENNIESSVEPFTNFFMARIIQDFNNGNTSFGGAFSATNRNNNEEKFYVLPDGEYTGGLDFQHYWRDQTFMIKAVGFFSHVVGSKEAILNLQELQTRYYQRPDADHVEIDTSLTHLSGLGGGFRFAKVGNGNWRYSFSLNFRSPGFDSNGLGFIRNSDEIQNSNSISYQIVEPKGIFNNFYVGFNNWNSWGFDMSHNSSGLGLSIDSKFKNYWSVDAGINKNSEYRNRFALRGGPGLISPSSYSGQVGIETDERKNLGFYFKVSGEIGEHNVKNSQTYRFDVNFRASTALSISLNNSFSINKNPLQYLGTYVVNGSDQYLLGTIDSKQFRISARINYCITPDLSIQYYAQPFIYAGKYSAFKQVTNSTADNYFDRFHEFMPQELTYSESNDKFTIHQDGETYSFDNPDFNSFAFNSNLVIRWEYTPGSTLFLVWSQGRSGGRYGNEFRNFNFSDDVESLFDIYPSNVFLIKFSYRFVI